MLVSPTDCNTITCEGLDKNKDLWRLEEDILESILPHLQRRNNILQFRAENIILSYSGWKMKLPWYVSTVRWILDDDPNKSIKTRLSMYEWISMQIAISPDERFLASCAQ